MKQTHTCDELKSAQERFIKAFINKRCLDVAARTGWFPSDIILKGKAHGLKVSVDERTATFKLEDKEYN